MYRSCICTFQINNRITVVLAKLPLSTTLTFIRTFTSSRYLIQQLHYNIINTILLTQYAMPSFSLPGLPLPSLPLPILPLPTLPTPPKYGCRIYRCPIFRLPSFPLPSLPFTTTAASWETLSALQQSEYRLLQRLLYI